MSGTEDKVSVAFSALVKELKEQAFADDVDTARLGLLAGYVQAVAPMSKFWAQGLPVNGSVPGKRGRKPKDAASETSEPAAPAGAEAPLTETQSEGPAPAASSGRGRRGGNE
jgi:hypothetical protein